MEGDHSKEEVEEGEEEKKGSISNGTRMATQGQRPDVPPRKRHKKDTSKQKVIRTALK